MLHSLRIAVQRRLRQAGIEVRKAPASGFRPLDVFRLSVEALMAKRGDAVRFVQIGANDGKFVDPLRRYVLKHPWRGVLVEPQPKVFAQLKANYAGLEDRLAFENVAIAPGDSVTLYLPPEGGADPTFERSVVSTDPKIIGRQLGLKKSPQALEVPAMTLDALLAKHGLTELDLLQIDVEGFDWPVLQTLDLAMVQPTIIQLEHGHMERPAIARMVEHLNAHRYDVYYGGYQGDTVAVHQRLLEAD
jgi:FkbM family methyltransferase